MDTSTTSNDQQNLSEAWKAKFEILERTGLGECSIFKPRMPQEFKDLGFGDRLRASWKVSFNLPAFFLGPFYYFNKKMWLKGVLISGAVFVLLTLFVLLIETVLRISLPVELYVFLGPSIYGLSANSDYYRFVKYGEKIWPECPDFLSNPYAAVSCSLGACVLFLFIPTTIEETNVQMLSQVSGIWRDSTGDLLSINLGPGKKTLEIGGTAIPVAVDSIDRDNHTVTLIVNGKSQHIWTLRQIFDDDETGFTLLITLHDGTQDNLSFVRNVKWPGIIEKYR